MPSVDELADLYTQGYYDSWGGKGAEIPPYWELKRALFQSLVAKLPALPTAEKALDLGCATGACLSVFSDMGLRPHGIDVNPFAVSQARLRVPDAVLHNGTMDTRPEAMNGYCLVVLSDVIEHVADPRDLLRQVAGALSPGGVVAILTPDIDSVSAKIMRGAWPHYKSEHITLMGRKAVTRILREAGFKDVRIQTHAKALSIDYAEKQFQAYPVPFVTPTIGAISRILPQFVRSAVVPVPIGEMVVFALKDE